MIEVKPYAGPGMVRKPFVYDQGQAAEVWNAILSCIAMGGGKFTVPEGWAVQHTRHLMKEQGPLKVGPARWDRNGFHITHDVGRRSIAAYPAK